MPSAASLRDQGVYAHRNWMRMLKNIDCWVSPMSDASEYTSRFTNNIVWNQTNYPQRNDIEIKLDALSR